MKKYLDLNINILERKLSDEAYLPLMEVNLQKSGDAGKLLKKPLRKKTKRISPPNQQISNVSTIPIIFLTKLYTA